MTERWALDMALFAIRGRIRARAKQVPLRSTVRSSILLDYEIKCPGRSLARGRRTARGFRFEAGA